MKATGTPAAEIAVDVLAVPVFEEDVRGGGRGRVKALDALLDGNLRAAAGAERRMARPGDRATTSAELCGRVVPRRRRAAREGDVLGRDGLRALRVAAGKAARAAAKAGAWAPTVALPDDGIDDVAGAARATRARALGAYAFERHKRDDGDKRTPLAELTLAVPDGAERRAEVKDALALAREIACRQLGATS